MNDDLNRLIELGENARNIRDVYIAESTIEYNKKCDILSDKLRNASDIKTGDTVEIISGYAHRGKKARVHEIGFMPETRTYRFTKTRYASAHVSLLKKDGSLSKVSSIIQLKFLRKV